MQRITSRSAARHQPIIIAYYDEIMDQDVLRVVKKIRKRAGLSEMDNEPIKPSTRQREMKHHSLLPKYNVEVQTDALNKEQKTLPITRRTGRNAKKEYREVIDFVDYEYNEEDVPLRPRMKMAVRNAIPSSKPGKPISRKTLERPKHKKPPKLDIELARQVEDYDSPSKHIQLTEEKVSLGVPSHDDSFTLFPETPQEVFQQRPLFMCAPATTVQPSFSFAENDDDASSIYSKSTQASSVYYKETMFDRFVDRIFGPLVEMDAASVLSDRRPENDDDDSLIADSYISEYFRATSPAGLRQAPLKQKVQRPKLNAKQPALKHFQSLVQQLPSKERSNLARRSRSVLDNVVDQILDRVSSSKFPLPPLPEWDEEDDETTAFMREISFPISQRPTTTTTSTEDSSSVDTTTMGPRLPARPKVIMQTLKRWDALDAESLSMDSFTSASSSSDASNTIASKTYMFDRYDF